MCDMEYFSSPRPKFDAFDLTRALNNLKLHQDIQQTNVLARAYSYFTDEKQLARGVRRSELCAE